LIKVSEFRDSIENVSAGTQHYGGATGPFDLKERRIAKPGDGVEAALSTASGHVRHLSPNDGCH
jgi:hypothetical protein